MSENSGFRFWRLLGIAALLLLGGAIAAFTFWRGADISVVQARRGDAAEVVYATGVVEPVYWAKITALQRKRIIDLCRCEGEPVKKGDVLARLDDTEEQAVLSEIEARLERLEADAARLAKLVASNVSSRTAYEEALTQVREYEARLAAQQERIDDLSLKSPMDGIVLRRDGEIGEIAGITANEALLWVGMARPLRIAAEINEEDIVKVKPRQRVLLRHDGHEGDPLEAVVERLTPKGDPETKTFRAYLLLPDDTPLMIGMSVEANIVVREAKDVVLVPAEAVVDGKVQLVDGERLALTPVEVGIRGSGRVEIRSGIEVDDRLASPFRADLDDGARIRVIAPGPG
ncbi:MAG: efflux RND transporter periplasmic adaptor subunit [Rhizobiales bacterium]|nr:efflux RND transporter periplasmic adaptor subunit [Hyphomicrobiales bacterium]